MTGSGTKGDDFYVCTGANRGKEIGDRRAARTAAMVARASSYSFTLPSSSGVLEHVGYDDRRRSTLPSLRSGSTARSPIRERLG